MKRFLIILFVPFFLFSCFGGEKININNPSKNIDSNLGTLNKTDVFNEKELIINDEYIGENITDRFKEIQKAYDLRDCEKVKRIIKELKKNNPDTKSVKDFLKNTEIGKQYTKGTMCEMKITDDITDKFKEIQKAYDLKECERAKKLIKELKKDNPDTESVKDFLKNTEIGKQYTKGTMCKVFKKKLVVNRILLKFKEIREFYDSKECERAKKLIKELKKDNPDTESVKNFLKNTELGKKYTMGTMCNN